MIEILLLILVALVFYKTFPTFTTFALLGIIIFFWLHDKSIGDFAVPLTLLALSVYCGAFFWYGGLFMEWLFRRHYGLKSFVSTANGQFIYIISAVVVFVLPLALLGWGMNFI